MWLKLWGEGRGGSGRDPPADQGLDQGLGQGLDQSNLV